MPVDSEKEVTIYDLARQLDISAATVSRALKDSPIVHPKTRKRIHELAQTMGYRSNQFARNLRHQRTNTIGVIIPRLNSYFTSAVIAGMENIASRSGFNLLISQSSESIKKEVINAGTMFANRVDGLLVSSAYDSTNSHHFNIFLEKKIPVVFFDRVTDDSRFTKVVIDNRNAARQTTQHLIQQGCRHIVHITAQMVHSVYAERLQGYKDALTEASLPLNESQVLYTNLSYDAGTEAAQRILQMNPLPDGVFVANDNCAVSCMATLKEAGIRIPTEMAFAGFNNDPVSKVIEPNLTTINYPGYKMGEVAMRHLADELNTDISTALLNTIVLRSELVVRASSLRSGSPL